MTLVLSSIVVVSLVPLALETMTALLRGDVEAIPFFLIFLLLPANLGLVGAVLTTRRPENAIGWLLLLAGVLAGLTFAAGEYERSAIAAGAWDRPLLVLAAWVASSWFIPAIGILVVFLPLLFPTGHLLSPRWRWVAVAGVFGVGSGGCRHVGASQALTGPRINPMDRDRGRSPGFPPLPGDRQVTGGARGRPLPRPPSPQRWAPSHRRTPDQ